MIPGGLWLLIFLGRALAGRVGGGGKAAAPAASGSTNIDAYLIGLTVTQLFAVIFLAAPLGGGGRGALLAALLVLAFPHWAAWRICQPLGLRAAGLGLLYLVWAPPVSREGRRQLFAWSLPGKELPNGALRPNIRWSTLPKEKVVPATAWTACGAALRAEVEGEAAQADRLVRGLLDLPARPRLPATVARLGLERLAFAALRRRDWPAVMSRASCGRGRGCRFLRLLARARLRGDVAAPWLWFAWLCAPQRMQTLPFLRETLAAGRSRPRPLPAPADPSPWATHVRLLDAGARGARVERADVLALAARWDAPLDPGACARLTARALELGVADPAAAAGAVRAGVLADLESLAAAAEGSWPEELGDDSWDGLPGLLYASAEDRLHDELDEWVRAYRNGEPTSMSEPLVEWDRWLAFRSVVERLEEAFGGGAVASAWYGGLRLAAWNWPCRVLEAHQAAGAWIAHVMFGWTVAMAERFDDEEAASVNRRNVAAAASKLPH